jgi:hypothetical protein|tara:strand:+ start:417 stop:770 length:354 start_codon:yes stop_codon:yes gene_type:complete
MALGNANSSAQSRGKNKAVVVKRRKEVVAAKNYNTVSLSPVGANAPAVCSYSGSEFTTYYHNGSNANPAVNDIVYSSRRAKNPNVFTAGFYRMDLGKSNIALHIDNKGVVIAGAPCP